MSDLVHDLLCKSAARRPDAAAITFKERSLTYARLWENVTRFAQGLSRHHLDRRDRVGIYLEKRFETVVAIFGAAAAGGAFVPINPLLRTRQVVYILRDCNVRVLVTSKDRLALLSDALADCPDLRLVVVVDGSDDESVMRGPTSLSFEAFMSADVGAHREAPRVIDTDMAAILYTSGSTGMPKGVVLSHRNLVAGAKSVSSYLGNNEDDRILSVLPLSFDAGFSQLTTAFHVGASVVLMNYLLPKDVVRLCAAERVTGLTGVPPLWVQLAQLDWPRGASESMRYFANTGGHMPRAILERLRQRMLKAKPYLMYGLTEAFRSTYLDPAEVDRRPDSIGKAIPNTEILVVRENGEPCQPGEPGELVHRGALVSMGYWNDPERTRERFRPTPGQPAELPISEIAVWSGDVVRKDEDGFLYFVGRKDDMIKTSGYRVSPTEVEDVIYSTGLVSEAAAVGVPHSELGQAIVVVAVGPDRTGLNKDALLERCRQELPLYMVPSLIAERSTLPRTPNGKIDRKLLTQEFTDAFAEAAS